MRWSFVAVVVALVLVLVLRSSTVVLLLLVVVIVIVSVVVAAALDVKCFCYRCCCYCCYCSESLKLEYKCVHRDQMALKSGFTRKMSRISKGKKSLKTVSLLSSNQQLAKE